MIHVLISDDLLSEYLFKELDGIDTIFKPIVKHNPLIHRLIKGLYYKVWNGFYSYYLPKDVVLRLKRIPCDDTLIVIGEDSYSYFMLSHICSHVKKKVAYFWNPASILRSQKVCRTIAKQTNREAAVIDYIKKLGFSVATFDPNDSKEYNIGYFPQFYRFVQSPSLETKYDFLFLGRDKGRKETLQSLEIRLRKFGRCNFNICGTNSSSDFIGYLDYIKLVKESRCLCEILQKSQSGMTVRAVEALFHSKKLLTNNSSIKKYDFYNKNNILVLTKDTKDEEIMNFMDAPLIEIDKSILKSYDVYSMLQFLDNFCDFEKSKES